MSGLQIWMKLLIGGVLSFIIGGVFWAGAAYQRFSGMELHLISIDEHLTRIEIVQSEMRSSNERISEIQRRLDKIENK